MTNSEGGRVECFHPPPLRAGGASFLAAVRFDVQRGAAHRLEQMSEQELDYPALYSA